MLGFLVNTAIATAILYNIHLSFKASNKAERKFFKHYFVDISLLLAMDNVLSFVLYRIPYYRVFKVALLLWLSVPQGTGPHFIYNVYIKNIERLFEGDIDAVIQSFRSYTQDLKKKYYETVKKGSKGEIEVGFGDRTASLKVSEPLHESSDAEPSEGGDDEEQGKSTVPTENK